MELTLTHPATPGQVMALQRLGCHLEHLPLRIQFPAGTVQQEDECYLLPDGKHVHAWVHGTSSLLYVQEGAICRYCGSQLQDRSASRMYRFIFHARDGRLSEGVLCSDGRALVQLWEAENGHDDLPPDLLVDLYGGFIEWLDEPPEERNALTHYRG